MKKFEYQYFDWTVSNRLEQYDTVKKLNEFGDLGWRMISPPQVIRRTLSDMLLGAYFVREKADEDRI